MSLLRITVWLLMVFVLAACQYKMPDKHALTLHHEVRYHDFAAERHFLEHNLAGKNVKILHQRSHLRIIFPSHTNFLAGNSTLNRPMMQQLDVITRMLRRFQTTKVIVHGFADSKGNARANQALAERRAHAVAGYLASQHISPSRLLARGKVLARGPRRTELTIHKRRFHRHI